MKAAWFCKCFPCLWKVPFMCQKEAFIPQAFFYCFSHLLTFTCVRKQYLNSKGKGYMKFKGIISRKMACHIALVHWNKRKGKRKKVSWTCQMYLICGCSLYILSMNSFPYLN